MCVCVCVCYSTVGLNIECAQWSPAKGFVQYSALFLTHGQVCHVACFIVKMYKAGKLNLFLFCMQFKKKKLLPSAEKFGT